MKLVVERTNDFDWQHSWQVRNDWNDDVIRKFADRDEAIEFAEDYAHHQDFDGVVIPPRRA